MKKTIVYLPTDKLYKVNVLENEKSLGPLNCHRQFSKSSKFELILKLSWLLNNLLWLIKTLVSANSEWTL